MKHKSNFNGAKDKFSRCIYNSAKGKVRLAVLQRDLAELHQGPKLRILDVGAGMGQMALWFAEAGHEVVLCDVSEDMLMQAKATAQERQLLGQVSFYHSGIEELPIEVNGFDLILCHAVLEWIEDQAHFIQLLVNRLKDGGHLSLMAFNRKALFFNHLIAGNFEYAQEGMKRRSRQRLTPNWPVEPKELEQWIKISKLATLKRSGVRIFSDYVRDKSQVELQEERVLALELQQSEDPDWLPTARYLHYFCQLNNDV